ncbi:MAG: phosphate ABC transporter permease PstA [Microthrixaceae bacterium]
MSNIEMKDPGDRRITLPHALRRRQLDLSGVGFRLVVVSSTLMAMGILAILVFDVLGGGVRVLSTRPIEFLTSGLSSSPLSAGVSQAIRGTIVLSGIVAVVAFPVGIGAAIHLEEFASDNRLRRFLDLSVRNLAGVPSVVYGILGLTIFVRKLGGIMGPGTANGSSVLSAGLTLAVLVLPIVVITASEAIRAVPQGVRDAASAMGATRWEVTRTVVLPMASPGILTGVVLAITRAMGEAAPLVLIGATTGFLTGGDSYAPSSFTERFTALPVVIAEWSSRPQSGFRDQLTPAAITVLLALVVLVNSALAILRRRMEHHLSG